MTLARVCAADTVALRKESVDRNVIYYSGYTKKPMVALRKESVDRNCYLDNIEITEANVALRKESVDRNCKIDAGRCEKVSRSPQGERG